MFFFPAHQFFKFLTTFWPAVLVFIHSMIQCCQWQWPDLFLPALRVWLHVYRFSHLPCNVWLDRNVSSLDVEDQRATDCWLGLQATHFGVESPTPRTALNHPEHRFKHKRSNLPWDPEEETARVKIGRISKNVVWSNPRSGPCAEVYLQGNRYS